MALVLLSSGGLAIANPQERLEPLLAEIYLAQQSTPTEIPNQGNIDQTIEQIRQNREQKIVEEHRQLLAEFRQKFGYKPQDYELKYNLAGSYPMSLVAYWVKFHVLPEQGIVKVGHTTSQIDWFWGTTNWYDHEMISVRFILDPDACQALLGGKDCEVTGKDSIQLPNFISNHQIVKNGIWDIRYIESKEERETSFRIPKSLRPEGANDSATFKSVNRYFCQAFPDGLACQKSAEKN